VPSTLPNLFEGEIKMARKDPVKTVDYSKRYNSTPQRKAYIKIRDQSPERKEWFRLWRVKNRKVLSERHKVWRANNVGHCKDRLLQLRYGITAEEYDAKAVAQDNKCALCGCAETFVDSRSKAIRVLSTDHNHVTGKARDLLCHRCNTGIGIFNDDVNLLLKAIQYLQKHEVNNV
jgi:hypothetical protein